MRAARSHGSADRFDLWRIPGRKRLTMGAAELTLTAEMAELNMRVSLASDVAQDAAYICAVPLTTGLRGKLDAFGCQAKALQGEVPFLDAARPATRGALLHLRALQAVDVARLGASHRDIAQALFGLEAVVMRWNEDGELRAQVRHLLRRADAFMAGGYLALAGIAHSTAEHPGRAPRR